MCVPNLATLACVRRVYVELSHCVHWPKRLREREKSGPGSSHLRIARRGSRFLFPIHSLTMDEAERRRCLRRKRILNHQNERMQKILHQPGASSLESLPPCSAGVPTEAVVESTVERPWPETPTVSPELFEFPTAESRPLPHVPEEPMPRAVISAGVGSMSAPPAWTWLTLGIVAAGIHAWTALSSVPWTLTVFCLSLATLLTVPPRPGPVSLSSQGVTLILRLGGVSDQMIQRLSSLVSGFGSISGPVALFHLGFVGMAALSFGVTP